MYESEYSVTFNCMTLGISYALDRRLPHTSALKNIRNDLTLDANSRIFVYFNLHTPIGITAHTYAMLEHELVSFYSMMYQVIKIGTSS